MSPFLSSHFFFCVRPRALSLALHSVRRESGGQQGEPSPSLTLIHEDVAWGLRCRPAKSVDGVDELSTTTMARRAPLLLPRIAAPAAAARRPSSGPVTRLDDMFWTSRLRKKKRRKKRTRQDNVKLTVLLCCKKSKGEQNRGKEKKKQLSFSLLRSTPFLLSFTPQSPCAAPTGP